MNAALDSCADRSSTQPSTASHAGLRTCIGCRARDDRSALVRVASVVVQDQPQLRQVVIDERGRLPGRGAWLHPRVECVERAVQRQAFARALRVLAPVDITPLQAWCAMHDLDASPDASSRKKNRKRV